MQLRTARDAARANRAIFTAGVNPHGLRCQVQIVTGGGGVYSGASFKLQWREALRGWCLHFEAFLRVLRC